jgi:signal transduction histidine kinase
MRWLLSPWLLACWFALCGLGSLPALASETVHVDEVRRIVTLGERVISDEVVSLPDRLDRALRDETLRIAYEFVVHPASTSTQGLWLFRAGAPYRLFLNGRPESPLLPLRETTADRETSLNGRSPALFVLPSDSVNVRIEFLALPFMPVGLVELHSGPLDALTLTHLVRYESAARPVFLSGAIASTLGLLLLLLWVIKRSMKALLFISFMCLCIALRDWLYSSSQLPLPALVFEQANPFLIMCFAVTAQAVTLLLVNQLTLERGRLLWGIVGVMTLLFGLSLVHPPSTIGVRSVSLALSIGGLFVTIALLWYGRASLSRLRVLVLSGGYLILVGGSLHDFGMMTGHVPPTQGTQIVWGFLALLLAFTYITAEFVLRNLSLAENANQMLEQKVRETTEALEQSYQALAAHQSREARRQERSHIMRELHDSLGSQLITALRGVERDALSKQDLLHALEDSLSDLRQLLSTNRADGHLIAVLATWRQHWEHRLDSAGVRTRWDMDDSVEGVVLPPETLHHLLRILQESATNTLKHAEADTFYVSAHRTDDLLELAFCDNGKGLPPPASQGSDPEGSQSGGQGLSGMQTRAKQIGARLQLTERQEGMGVCVRVSLPLDARASSDASGAMNNAAQPAT